MYLGVESNGINSMIPTDEATRLKLIPYGLDKGLARMPCQAISQISMK